MEIIHLSFNAHSDFQLHAKTNWEYTSKGTQQDLEEHMNSGPFSESVFNKKTDKSRVYMN